MIDKEKIEFNTGLLIDEMSKRGINIDLVGKSSLIVASYGDHIEYLDETNLNTIPYVTKFILDNKYLTKDVLLRSGISVNKGECFGVNELSDAITFAHKIGYPVVIKPSMGSNGVNVHMNITNVEELMEAFKNVAGYIENSYYNSILVEKQFEGEEYRIFATRGGYYAVVHRDRANVTGDGLNNIIQLIEKENYRRMNPRKTCLCTIKVDNIMHKYLSDNGLDCNYVPQKGEKIYVRPNSNISGGGNCHDITDNVYSGVFEIANKILHSFKGLEYVGIDYMTKDITKNNADKDYIICELNSCPGISLHTHEETGNYKNIPGVIIDILFPETKYE